MNNEYNKELILVHKFLQEKHKQFRENNQIKSDDDRRKYAHAVKTVGDIAYNCNITDKPIPEQNKRLQDNQAQKKHGPEFFNTIYDE